MIPSIASLYLNASHYSAAKSVLSYAPVANNREGCPTDDLNINKRGVQIKAGVGGGGWGGGLENILGQKWQPATTNYACPKQLLIVEKHQYNFSYSLHLYKTKQNVSNNNVNTKSCLRNQTHLGIHLLAVLVPSH